MKPVESFRNIGLIGRLESDLVVETVRHMERFLSSKNYNVIVDAEIASALNLEHPQISTKRMMGEACDLVIVVGGDGCMLGAARELARSRVSVIGVNRGRLGFLTDILPSELEERLTEILDGHYTWEDRFLLNAEIKRDGVVVGANDAFNDVVLHTGGIVHMIEFELYIDGLFVYSQRSDGLIVSTPTGSTAYALSGGGPIMHPKLDAIVLVPMFPHTLSSRPIVVGGNSEIKIVVSKTDETAPHMSCDGQKSIRMSPGDVIYVRKRPQKLRLLHPLGHNFYEGCRSKLGWSSKLT